MTLVQLIKKKLSLQWGSEYQPFENWKHLNSKLFEVLISNGLVFKWSVYVLCPIYQIDHSISRLVHKKTRCLVFKWHSNTERFGIQPLFHNFNTKLTSLELVWYSDPHNLKISINFLFRLVYMLQQSPPEISLKHVEFLIIDESDKLFEAGVRGFRDQVT